MKRFKLTWLQAASVGLALATFVLVCISLSFFILILTGCAAMNSLIIHPLDVLHQEREYQEQHPPAQTNALYWPADIPPLPTNGDTRIAPLVSPKIQIATSRASVQVSPVPTLEQFAARMGGSCLGLFEPAGDGTNYLIGNQCLTDYGVCCILAYAAEPTVIDTGTTNARTWEKVYTMTIGEAKRYQGIRNDLPQSFFRSSP